MDLPDRSSSVPPVLVRAPSWEDDTSPTEVFVRPDSLAPVAPACPREAAPHVVRMGHLGRGLTLAALVLVGFVSGHGVVSSWRHARGTAATPLPLAAAVATVDRPRTDMSVSPGVEPVPRVDGRPVPASSIAPTAVARPSPVPPPSSPAVVPARPLRGAVPAVKQGRRTKVDVRSAEPPRSSGDESRSRAIATARSALDGAL
ncbi:MAG: hypothetical protein U0183_08790 [Polyangiaceae bacterium]